MGEKFYDAKSEVLTKEDVKKLSPEQIKNMSNMQLYALDKDALGEIIYKLEPKQFEYVDKFALEANLSKVRKLEKAAFEVIVDSGKLSKVSLMKLKAYRITHKKNIEKGKADEIDKNMKIQREDSKKISKREKSIKKIMKKGKNITHEDAEKEYNLKHSKKSNIKITKPNETKIKVKKSTKQKEKEF